MARKQKRSKYNKSFNRQLHERMQQLNRIGTSKHKAKQAYQSKHNKANPAKTEGIHSRATYDVYKQVSKDIAKWLKENTHYRHIDDVPKATLIEYLQEKRDVGLSAWSLSRDMAALNKIFCTDITKKEADLPQRSLLKMTRSRMERKHDKQYNPKNYEGQISVAQAFGLRRSSIYNSKGDYKLKEGSIYKFKGRLYAPVIEKGGRFRNAPCLLTKQMEIEKQFPQIQERQTMMTEYEFKDIYKDLGKPLFDSYTKHIDNHAFRHQYARNLYQEYEKQTQNIKPTYRGYDKSILRRVSKALGHNRPSVVAEHYLR